MVTRFQQAVLQEMGIPLWVSQAAAKSESEPAVSSHTTADPAQLTQPSTRRSENSSSHLAALRQSLSGENSPSEVSPSEVSPSKASSNQTLTVETSSHEQQPTITRALSREEKQLAIMTDISLAYEVAGRPLPADIEVGDELTVTTTHLILPASPLRLKAIDKKQIWLNITDRENA